MNLDANTLFLVTIYVEAILGLLLLFASIAATVVGLIFNPRVVFLAAVGIGVSV